MRKAYHKILRLFEDPLFSRRFNGWAAVFFAILIIPSLILGWLEVVAFVSVLSIWALVAAHWSTWQAAKVEQKEDLTNSSTRKPIRVLHSKLRHRPSRGLRKPL